MNANEISQKLLANLGKKVSIENDAHENDSNKIGFNFAGTLEDSDGGEFYVRVGEDYMAGAMGISFRASHILELDKRVYGELRIILK